MMGRNEAAEGPLIFYAESERATGDGRLPLPMPFRPLPAPYALVREPATATRQSLIPRPARPSWCCPMTPYFLKKSRFFWMNSF